MPDVTALTMTDVQPKAGPALSATSDMPEVKAAAPAISEEIKPGESTVPAGDDTAPAGAETQAGDDSTAGDDSLPADGDKPEGEVDALASDKTPGWLKGLATKERNKARAAEVRAAAAEKLAGEATANMTKAFESIETLTKAQALRATEEAEKADPRPAREGFDDPAKYETALIDWAGRRAALVAKTEALKAIETEQASKRADDEKKAVEARNDEIRTKFAERREAFIKDHPDYAELVEQEFPEDRTKELQISMPMAQVILNDKDGLAIAYYLGKNPDEAARISKLPGVNAVTEMGRISARLATKPTPSTKPAPIKPLKTGSEAAVRKSPAEESMGEYGARRTRELANAERTRRGLAPLN